jgi:phage-related holin
MNSIKKHPNQVEMKDDFKLLLHVLQEFIDFPVLLFFVGSAIGLLMTLIADIQLFLAITLWMVFADFVVGIIAARHRKETISSSGIARTVSKFTVYILAILSGRGVEIVFLPQSIIETSYVTYMIAGTITLREFKSLLENVEDITGVEFVSLYDKISKLFKKQ